MAEIQTSDLQRILEEGGWTFLTHVNREGNQGKVFSDEEIRRSYMGMGGNDQNHQGIVYGEVKVIDSYDKKGNLLPNLRTVLFRIK